MLHQLTYICDVDAPDSDILTLDSGRARICE